jgi:hypothetical protein
MHFKVKGERVLLARIKFVQQTSSILNKQEHSRLEDFLGEKVEVNQMKFTEDGKYETVSWRETFDKEKAEKNSDYKLVTPADMYYLSDNNNFLVDLERFTSEFPNIEVTIKGVPKSVGTDYHDMLNMMNKISDRIEEAKNKFDKVVEFNQKCEVHIPNLGLLNINRLAYATDYCTEELQRILHKGWRILAICPQPDQRRPDYILGMHVSDFSDDVEVEYFQGYGREGNLKERDREKVCNF